MAIVPSGHLRRVIVHVGAHKTGTTSIQHFMQAHAKWLAQHGVTYAELPEVLGSKNHFGLNFFALNNDRYSIKKARLARRADFDLSRYRDDVQKAVKHVLERTTDAMVVFSNEGLSLIRYRQEVIRLIDLFEGYRPEFVLYEREAADFLRSRAHQFARRRIRPSANPDHAHYLPPDVSHVNWDCLAANLGHRDHLVHRRSYDVVVRANGSVVDDFLDLISLPRKGRPDTSTYWLNRDMTRT